MKISFFKFFLLLNLFIFSKNFAYSNDNLQVYFLGSQYNHGNRESSDFQLLDTILESYNESKALIFCNNPLNKIIFSEFLATYNYWSLGKIAQQVLRIIDLMDDWDFEKTIYVYKPMKDNFFIKAGVSSKAIDVEQEVLEAQALAMRVLENYDLKKLTDSDKSSNVPPLVIKTYKDCSSDMKITIINTKK